MMAQNHLLYRRLVGLLLVGAGLLIALVAVALTRYDAIMIENTLAGLDSGALSFAHIAGVAGAFAADGYLRAAPLSALVALAAVSSLLVVAGVILTLKEPRKKLESWCSVSFWLQLS